MSRSAIIGVLLLAGAGALFIVLLAQPYLGDMFRDMLGKPWPAEAPVVAGDTAPRYALAKESSTVSPDVGVRPGGRSAVARSKPGKPGEFVVRVAPEGDMQEVADLAARLGLRVLATDTVLRALRLSGDEAARRTLQRSSEARLTIEENVLVYVPFIGADVVRELLSGRPFGDGALAGIGVVAVGPQWGEGVTVALLDSGVLAHPSLHHLNVESLDLVGEEGGQAGPFAGHATAVASLLAGTDGGIQGVAPAIDLISIKVVDSFGVGDAFTLAAGIVLAVDSGAKVISMSLGTEMSTPILEDAVAYAVRQGVALVAAAGNDAGNVLYPAACEGVVAVGAVDADGNRESYSNGGAALDIMAPGAGIVAGWVADQNAVVSGTSAAVPFVSGAISVLLGSEPAITVKETVEALLTTADDGGAPGVDPAYGAGILDVGRALRRYEPGRFDAALASHYLPASEADVGQVQVLVCAQNRGTETLSVMTVVSEYADTVVERRFINVSPGYTVSMPLAIPLDQINPEGGLELRSRVTISGFDENRANDSRTSRLQVGTTVP